MCVPCGHQVREYVAAMDRVKLRDGIRIAMAISSDGNQFIQHTEPFNVVKTDKEHAATLVAAGEGTYCCRCSFPACLGPSVGVG